MFINLSLSFFILQGLGGLRELMMDREAWCAVVHGVAKSWTWLSDWIELPTPNKMAFLPEVYICRWGIMLCNHTTYVLKYGFCLTPISLGLHVQTFYSFCLCLNYFNWLQELHKKSFRVRTESGALLDTIGILNACISRRMIIVTMYSALLQSRQLCWVQHELYDFT